MELMQAAYLDLLRCRSGGRKGVAKTRPPSSPSPSRRCSASWPSTAALSAAGCKITEYDDARTHWQACRRASCARPRPRVPRPIGPNTLRSTGPTHGADIPRDRRARQCAMPTSETDSSPVPMAPRHRPPIVRGPRAHDAPRRSRGMSARAVGPVLLKVFGPIGRGNARPRACAGSAAAGLPMGRASATPVILQPAAG